MTLPDVLKHQVSITRNLKLSYLNGFANIPVDGTICEDEHNKFIDDVSVEISVLGTGISRSVYRDRNDEKRWDPSRIPGLLGEKDVDGATNTSSEY